MFLANVAVSPGSPILFPGLGLTLNPGNLVFPASWPILGNIHWYGLVIALGFLLAVIYGNKRAKQFGITEDNLISMLLCAVPAAIVFARAYYCIFNWSAFADDPVSCLYIWEGGIAIYGGVIGAVLAAYLYCKFAKVRFGAMADLGGLGLLIGQSAGRWGNFFNREAFGGPTDNFLRMGLYDYAGNLEYYHPTFLYESLWNMIGFVVLHFLSKKRKFDGEIFCLYIAWYGFGRFFIEGLRTDSLYLFDTGLRVSQLLAVVSCLLALAVFFFRRKNIGNEPLWVDVCREKENDCANDENVV